jgi:hypothetical protein
MVATRLVGATSVLLALASGIPPVAKAAQAEAKPAIAAPQPPRLPDGKPNWTGFWAPPGGLLDRNFGPGATSGPPAARAGGAQTPAPPYSPLKSPYKERYEANIKAAEQGTITFDPGALCLPSGMPRMMGAIYGMELLQTPGQVTITAEYPGSSRRIWLDGRKHPDPEETLATYSGHSIGHWEGDVLVADTILVRADVPIDQSGLPHTENMHITERFYQSEPGILVDEITVNDPEVYTKPWTVIRRYSYRPDLNLEEFVCLENNRNVGANGEPTFK